MACTRYIAFKSREKSDLGVLIETILEGTPLKGWMERTILMGEDDNVQSDI